MSDEVSVEVREDAVVGLDPGGAELWLLPQDEADPVVGVTEEDGALWLVHFYGTRERIDPATGTVLEEGFGK